VDAKSIRVAAAWNTKHNPKVRSTVDLSEFNGISWRLMSVEQTGKLKNGQSRVLYTLETSNGCPHFLADGANSRRGGKWRYAIGIFNFEQGYLPKGNDIKSTKGSYQKAMAECRQLPACRAVTFTAHSHIPPPTTTFFLKSKLGQAGVKYNNKWYVAV
jgi:hypothetical protein